MVGHWFRRPERVLLASVGGLVFLLVLGFVLSGMAAHEPTTRTGGWGYEDEQRVVVSRMLEVPAGNVVSADLSEVVRICRIGPVNQDCLTLPARAGYEGAVEFYIVESGEAQAFVKGTRPEHIYAYEKGPGIWTTAFSFIRPSPPASKASLPTSWTSRGTTISVPGITAPNGLEFVFILPPGPVSGVAYDPALLEVKGAVHAFEPWLPPAQVGLAGLEAVAVGGLGWSGLVWARRRPAPVAPEARGSEALLHLMSRAQSYLQGLRNALRVTGLLLALLGVIVLFLLQAERGRIAALSPLPQWPLLVALGIWVGFGGLAAVWYGHYRVVTAELRRWTEQMAQPPRIGEDP